MITVIMFVPYAPASEGGLACAAGQSEGLPLSPTRLSGDVGDHGTAVPAVTEGTMVPGVAVGGVD